KLFQRRVRWRREKVNAAGLAVFAEALDIILHCLLIMLHAIPAKSDFLDSTGFRVHQPEIAKRGGVELFRSKDLDDIHLKSAADESIESRFIPGGVEKIA